MKRSNYNLCEYNFNTLLLWSPFEQYHYIIENNIAYIISKGDNPHALMPLTEKENWNKGIVFLENLYCEKKDQCKISYASEEFNAYVKENYEDKYDSKTNRDFYDYLYKTKDLIELRGKEYANKRNHINKFLKSYKNRYEFRPLAKEDFKQCRNMIKEWRLEKVDKAKNTHKYLRKNYIATGINNLLTNFEFLDYKISGLFIDNVLEGFTIGSLLQSDIAQIHIENANPDIRGIYQIINKMFLEKEFKFTKFVNREDDAGVKGLRIAKKSYNPLKLIKKYDIYLKED
ncbi:MAG: DUF2156 domain-containing protein [Clostridia bacterium]